MESLLQEITRCPHVQFCIENSSVWHPCREIVFSQSFSTLGEYQVPEPWSGNIEQAPILFLSSNPSISDIEDYPRWFWSDENIDDYFNNRFGGGRKVWTVNGRKTLQIDGTYSRSIHFWREIRQRACELLDRDAISGVDYAITEIVHCKSRNEVGVKQAQKQCVPSYLRRVLQIASARVIVVLGVRAKQAIKSEFNIPPSVSLWRLTTTDDRERSIAFLPHPSARSVRSFAKCFSSDEVEYIRAFLR